MPPQLPRRSPSQDLNHLDMLAIAYYIAGAVLLCLATLPVTALVAVLRDSSPQTLQALPAASGFTLNVIHQPASPASEVAVVATTLIALFAIMIPTTILLSGRFLHQRRHYPFSVIVAFLLCLAFPLGTVLGVLTLIVLARDSVKDLYHQAAWWNSEGVPPAFTRTGKL